MGRDLGPAKPEDVGLSTEGLARIDAAIQGYIDSGGLAGAVTLVARRGKIVHTCAMGKKDLASGQSPASDTLFRIFSMTNPVTGVAMMILFDQGLWRSEDPIAQHLPEFADVKVFVDVDRAGQPRLEFRLGKGPISETVTPALGSGSIRSMTCCSSV